VYSAIGRTPSSVAIRRMVTASGLMTPRDQRRLRRVWDYFVRHLLGTEPPEHSPRPFPADLDLAG
jgi:hypothetical protein